MTIPSRHTPGPWSWEYGVSQRTAWALCGPGGKYILRFKGGNDIDECPEPEADMDLIELAPRMLSALQAVQDCATSDLPRSVTDEVDAILDAAAGKEDS